MMASGNEITVVSPNTTNVLPRASKTPGVVKASLQFSMDRANPRPTSMELKLLRNMKKTGAPT